jgi:ABC-type transporter Mla subunit MlaD
MHRSSTAREALVAELIGDLATLIERVDTLTPAIDDARLKMTTAAHELAAGVAPFRAHMVDIAAQTQKTSVQYILSRTNETAAKLLEVQTQAMTTSARAIVDKEVGPPLRELATNLEQLVASTHRPWDVWALHAATAMVSAICSAMLVLYVVYR